MMKILYAASEALPFAATGGLGDVIGSLPSAVKDHIGDDCDVRVVIPMYPNVRRSFDDELKFVCETTVRLSWRQLYCGIWSVERHGVTYYFLDNEFYFKREQLYGSFDDGERFAFFGKAVLDLMAAVNFYPDVLHANDWQSALSVIYLKRKYNHLPEYSRIAALYTIHNIEYQGIYDLSILGDVFDLDERDRSIVEYNGAINLTKGAIVTCDRLSTVSEQYADEITSDYYASGLHHIIRMSTDKLSGIVNGIDYDYYNPATDPDIAVNYSSKSIKGKKEDKAELCRMCGFDEKSAAPVIAMVSRLASHKGFDLVCRVIEEMLNYDDIRFVILGTGEYEFEQYFASLNGRYPEKFRAIFEFNKPLSKKIYAGSDMYLMPSKSEPCGLSQMIASRYGSVPIVRETGGLKDTIEPYNKYEKTGNGFSFTNYNAHDMMNVIREAVAIYSDKRSWNSLVKKTMNKDFSWNASAKKYIELYESMERW